MGETTAAPGNVRASRMNTEKLKKIRNNLLVTDYEHCAINVGGVLEILDAILEPAPFADYQDGATIPCTEAELKGLYEKMAEAKPKFQPPEPFKGKTGAIEPNAPLLPGQPSKVKVCMSCGGFFQLLEDETIRCWKCGRGFSL